MTAAYPTYPLKQGAEDSQNMSAIVHDHRRIIRNRVEIGAKIPDRLRVKEQK